MDGGAWWAIVYGVATSWTRLSDFTFTFFHETQTGALYQPRGVGWRRRREGCSKGRGYIYIPMADSC